MPSVDEMFDESASDETDHEDARPESKPLTEARRVARKLEKQVQAYEKELADLRAYREEHVKAERNVVIESSFKEAGLNPKHAKLFSALNPDVDPAAITKEAIATFASEYSLAPEEGSVVEAPLQATGFVPTSTSMASAPSGVVSRDEWMRLSATDPVKAEALWSAGRVDLAGLREGLGPQK